MTVRTIKTVGEFGLINILKEGTIVTPETVRTGIGDDAAAYCPAPGSLQLLTTDMLVETIHFKRHYMTAWQLGYKSMAVNISDIAAMGGAPRHAVVSIAIPPQISVEYIQELYQGMKAICHRYGVNIIGGDTVSIPDYLAINVTLTGEVTPERIVLRSGAREGDKVIVTGMLGDAAAGLAWLDYGDWRKAGGAERISALVQAHLQPEPQVQIGQLAACFGATSMNDISDGLASEANEIAKASGVALCLQQEAVPVSPAVEMTAGFFNRDVLDYALFGGEDYQLVFTMPVANLTKLRAAHPELPLTVVGEVTGTGPAVYLLNRQGESQLLEPRGYNHFRG
ncbi:thiamine-phosphate kinase [Acetonema longum]|uniref:Thiamine-monophosphate kinase n=1 Tax=Acetonema longum DSM 6540 TaxID=1009370 RepID=F7NI52_9FIRM|nr:thiamine-phosphate kinase [Acetonema longum]EGO64284.1 thiamine-monophosphate kinase [Acetonema longum DSM 6540]